MPDILLKHDVQEIEAIIRIMVDEAVPKNKTFQALSVKPDIALRFGRTRRSLALSFSWGWFEKQVLTFSYMPRPGPLRFEPRSKAHFAMPHPTTPLGPIEMTRGLLTFRIGTGMHCAHTFCR